jgi:hypothetical protein
MLLMTSRLELSFDLRITLRDSIYNEPFFCYLKIAWFLLRDLFFAVGVVRSCSLS